MIQKLFLTTQTVFTLKDIGVFFPTISYDNLKARVAYRVKQDYLKRIRKGIYVKSQFDIKELACILYSPSYISFETILSEHNLIYQYDSTIYVASYLSRTIHIPFQGQVITICYRKLRDNRLFDTRGVVTGQWYSYATRDRAIEDMRYLQPHFYFDRLPDEYATAQSDAS